MKGTLRKIFSKEVIFEKKEHIPKFLYKRYHKLLAFTGISLVLGASCVLMAGNPLLIIPFAFLTLSLLIVALHFKYSIEEDGFILIQGKVIFVKEMLTTDISVLKNRSLKRPSYYHIQTEAGDVIRIAANKVSEEIPEGMHLNVYAPLHVYTYDRNGVLYLSAMWGYEIDGSRADAEDAAGAGKE